MNLADRVTGLHAVYAVTAALFHRERTRPGPVGRGPDVREHRALRARRSPGRPVLGAAHRRQRLRAAPASPALRTRDGYLCVLVYNDKQWKSFLEAVGRPDMMADERFFPHGEPRETRR